MKSWLKNVILLKEVDNIKFYVRRYDNSYDHKSSDYLYEYDLDTRTKKRSLMPNHHSIYFEIMIDNDFSKRIGCPTVLNCSGGLINASNNYINNVMMKRIEKFKKAFQKWLIK